MKNTLSLAPISIEDIRKVIQDELLSESKSVQRKLQYIALEETVEYIQKNMQHVNSVISRYDLLTICMSNLSKENNGLICEFGVYVGNSINHIAMLTKRTVYGFDSFKGLPERWRDRFDKGSFKMDKLPKVEKNVKLIQGLFHQTIPDFLEKHIDCDIYSSAKTIFETIGDRIVPGTIIAFDDFFNYPGWKQGEFKAFSEFIENSGLKFEYIGFNRCSEQVAIKIISHNNSL